jgi:hypothetical protein
VSLINSIPRKSNTFACSQRITNRVQGPSHANHRCLPRLSLRRNLHHCPLHRRRYRCHNQLSATSTASPSSLPCSQQLPRRGGSSGCPRHLCRRKHRH